MDVTVTAYCRLCAEIKTDDKLIHLQSDEEKCQDIINKLSRFNLQIVLNDASILPRVICYTCFNALQRSFDFIVSVEQAQSTLNDLIILRQIKKEENVSDTEIENFTYEYQPKASYDSDADNIKQESDEKKLVTQSIVPKVETDSTQIKKSKKTCSNLDALPLSQLKLTWNDFNWLCSYCETEFPTLEELRRHSMEYHNICNPYRCTDCKRKKFTLNNFLIHVKRHRQYLKFSCHKCSMRFKSAVQSNKHKKTHIDSKFTCSGCNTGFQSQEELTTHTNTFYKDFKRSQPSSLQNGNGFTCPICEKPFKSKGNMTTHLQIHKDRKRNHTCEICGKCFFHKVDLEGHTILHSDERPFQCKICKSSFKTSRYLRNHIRIHDNTKPFSCETCGRCFRLKYHLKKHRIIHTDSLPHACSYCNKRFRFSSILVEHVRQHTGVKPYSCNICQRDFSNWPNYNKHMISNHGKDMSKSKHTPDGTFPVDPATGEIICTKNDQIGDWKNKVLQVKQRGRKRLRD